MTATRSRSSVAFIARRLLLGLALLSSVPACYTYVPTAAEPTPGALVRARLTSIGSDTLTARFGPGVEEVVGTYLGPEDGALSVLVSEYVSERGGRMTVWNEAVRVPQTGIAQLEQRQFSTTKSVLFGAAVIGGLSAAYVALDIGGRVFDDEDSPEPGPTDMRRPGGISIVLRFPVR